MLTTSLKIFAMKGKAKPKLVIKFQEVEVNKKRSVLLRIIMDIKKRLSIEKTLIITVHRQMKRFRVGI